MINLTSTSSAVSWPTTPPSTAIAPVVAVPAAPAISSGSHGTQTGPRSGRDGHAQPIPSPKGERQAAAGAPPLLPREGGLGQAGKPAADPRGQTVQQQAEQQAAHQAMEREKQAMEHWANVLSNVWQASAAVVDRALGLESSSTSPGSQSDTAPDLSSVAATLVARKLPVITTGPGRPAELAPAFSGTAWVSPAPNDEPTAALDSPSPEVVAYDEHGNSSLMPLEAGSLISHRV